MTCSRCRCDRAHFRAPLWRVAARETMRAWMAAQGGCCALRCRGTGGWWGWCVEGTSGACGAARAVQCGLSACPCAQVRWSLLARGATAAHEGQAKQRAQHDAARAGRKGTGSVAQQGRGWLIDGASLGAERRVAPAQARRPATAGCVVVSRRWGPLLGAVRLNCQARHGLQEQGARRPRRDGCVVVSHTPFAVRLRILRRGSACQPCKWLARPPGWQALCICTCRRCVAPLALALTLGGGSGTAREWPSYAQPLYAHREGATSACVGAHECRRAPTARACGRLTSVLQRSQARSHSSTLRSARAHRCSWPSSSFPPLSTLTLISCRPHRTPPGSPSRLATQQ